MEISQIICNNLGMTQDLSISNLSKGEDGATNYAFENHNIRVLAVNDDTKFSVTNEKSTKYEGSINGLFIGGCSCGRYLILFIKDIALQVPDYIYRLEYNGTNVTITELYHGNLNFNVDAPIEAIGYYESEEVQKVYWVDGLNQNRFINISPNADASIGTYNNYSFDFQGRISALPQVTITKDYNKVGTFQAGVIQYFMTYYNKYGVETCLAWSSDLQYLSKSDRGAKADEAVSCGLDFTITNILPEYDYLRIYACYRSGLNGEVTSRIVTDISLKGLTSSSVINFTDLGNLGINFNSSDMFYVGGQDIRANTLDYKQDTMFFGDIKVQNNIGDVVFPTHPVNITSKGDFEEEVIIQEGGDSEQHPFLLWSYKYVSPIAKDGVYSYTPEIAESQEDIAGFKYREVYRFGIQFMSYTGEWTSVYWIGDKYCNLPPRIFKDEDTYITNRIGSLPSIMGSNVPDLSVSAPTSVQIETIPLQPSDAFGDLVKTEYYNTKTGERVPNDGMLVNSSLVEAHKIRFHYKGEGCYIATIMLDINALKNSVTNIDFNQFVSYRLLVADTNISNRRIVEQGVINPTMFNYNDRYYNRPHTIPSWIFRPRKSAITNRHYDTLPVQTATNAELQGIVDKQVPGFNADLNGQMNSYMFIIGVNEASIWSGHTQWKLIYYNSGSTELEQAERLYLAMYKGDFPEETPQEEIAAEQQKVASLVFKYGVSLKSKDNIFPGEGIVKPGNEAEALSLVQNGYIPVYVYGDNYKVISSRIYRNDTGAGTTLPSSWADLRSKLVELITEDMKKTTVDEVGVELAGKIVLSTEMLPDEELIKMIARAGSDATTIGLSIMAALVAAAAVVISALSFGTLTAPMAVATATAVGAASAAAAVSAASSICAAAALGMASAATSLSLEDEEMEELPKRMLALGYFPVGQSDTGLDSRAERSKMIGQLLESMFTPDANVHGGYINNGGIYTSWNVPVLQGEAVVGGDVDFNDDLGRVPFTTGHPYTRKGFLGEDYNAFVSAGKLSSLTVEESDLNNKQNVFCVDESIVTLNTPTVEDTYHAVNSSEGYRLDLVGVIPIDSTYGKYDLVVENGLNSNSQVLQGRFITNNIGENPELAQGLLNGNIYQDFKCEESAIGEDLPIQVNEEIGTYKIFMWNKSHAGFWLPGVTLLDPIDSENKILTAKSKISRKVFANMRYSTYSQYFPTKKLSIESPISCLDAQVMLRTFKYNSDIKNYYENVDTISINNKYYPLIADNLEFPSTEEVINKASLKDPVHIRYKETPHIVIPIAWDKYKNAATILPYTRSEVALNPMQLYGKDTLGNIKLYGTANDAAPIGIAYKYFESYDDVDYSTTDVKYLLNINGYFTLVHNGSEWQESKVTALHNNTEIIIDDKSYYITKNIQTNGTVRLPENIHDVLTPYPLVGTWVQSALSWEYNSSTPYLFMGELVKKEFDYNTWNGGVSQHALEQLTWNVASKATPIEKHLNISWGDTYYQRWDCEKTYPFTEEDTNSNVEVLSFMLESHTNLDGRSDVNRGIHNLSNVRPSNTIYTDVYSQKDNFFTYQVLNDKFTTKEHFEADVVWSLTKSNMDDIDKWTCLVSTNEMPLDGRYGTIRKILNVNDSLIVFQDRGMSQIKYNETAALNTSSGLPIQMGNTGKVDGYRMISDTIGCHNKFSINNSSAGVFFADDYGKSFYQYTANNGIASISTVANFSMWFKKNLNGHIWDALNRSNFRTSYDEVTHDLYIISRDKCLLYNAYLQRFTSFMSYEDTPMVVRLQSEMGESDTFTIRSAVNNAGRSTVEIWKLFAGASQPVYDAYGNLLYDASGAYGYIYGEFRPYSMEYRLNPDPTHDSIFTNYQYTADWIDPSKEVEDTDVFDTAIRRYTTFDTVEAKNEYQAGIINALPTVNGYNRAMGIQPLKSKFRIWRGDIPRNGDTLLKRAMAGDRMRNPWIHLKFTKDTVDDSKMTFHNLIVTYYNQYGRY